MCTISLPKGLDIVQFSLRIEAVYQLGSPERRQLNRRTAHPVMSWGCPKLYLNLEISVLIEIGDFGTYFKFRRGIYGKLVELLC